MKNNLRAILIADDDLGDCQLIQKALEENCLKNPLNFVHDGEELMQYLKGEGKFNDRAQFPEPCIIFVDLNMPKKDGREAIEEIKSSELFKSYPIIVMTNSVAEEDIVRSYELGVNSYIQKPLTFENLIKVIKSIKNYWFEIVILPSSNR